MGNMYTESLYNISAFFLECARHGFKGVLGKETFCPDKFIYIVNAVKYILLGYLGVFFKAVVAVAGKREDISVVGGLGL